MALIDLTTVGILDAFASSDPTPGGGSASALAGATSAALMTMVAGLPKTKSNVPEERAALDAVLPELKELRATLTALIDRDAQAYDLVVAAFRKPKATDDEKIARKAAVQDATRVATEIPLETMKACAALSRIAKIVAENGNPNAASDVYVATLLADAAMKGARSNVDINLGGITDQTLVQSMRAQADSYDRA